MPYNPVAIQNLNPIFLGSEAMQEFCGAGTFTVPTYQRSYKWSTDDFKQLLNDLMRLNVADNFEGETQTKAHYMGNLFFFTRTVQVNTVSFHIIDGQQRLTTCVIFLSTIFFELQEVLATQNLQIEGPFRQKYEDLRSKFHTLIVRPNNQGAYYSRFDAGYVELPLACFINYVIATPQVLGFNDPCEFEPVEGSDLQARFLASVRLAHTELVKKLEKPAQETLNHATATAYSEKLLKLAVRIMDGLQFGVMTMEDAIDAYKVFVNLNSTGKPLTHFEIFCARIDQKINYEIDNLAQVDRIRGYLQNIQSELSPPNQVTNIQNENDLWDEIVQYWQVYDQPERLWESLDPAGLLAEKICQGATTGQQIETILRGLFSIIKLLNRPNEAVKEDGLDQEQRLCLELIRKNWPKGIHLVLPFYLNPQVTGENYTRPLKKIVAFWTLYRMVIGNRSTGRIQDAFKEPRLRHENTDIASNMAMREITLESLEEGLKRQLSRCTVAIAGFANPAMFTLNNQQIMDVWCQTAGNISSTINVVNRTILMFAYHNTMPGQSPDGYLPGVSLVPANEHVCHRLTYPFYQRFVLSGELEHVYPKNPDVPWPGVDEYTLNLIGNMHLAPSETNIFLTNNGPIKKKFFYEYFAAQIPEQRAEILQRMRNRGLVGLNEDIEVDVHVDHTIFGLVFNFWGLQPGISWDPDDAIHQPVWNNGAIIDRSTAVCRRAVANLLVWLNN